MGLGPEPLHSPVVLIIFNRPARTERVFHAIAKARPYKLFVIADGPRAGHPQDVQKCAAARAVIERIDWECEVHKEYADKNMGTGARITSGYDWVFTHVDRAIILEDDCVPHPTFFRFCDVLLRRYEDSEQVMMVSGRNHLGQLDTPFSYSFGRILMSIWGWATWRRSWERYDHEIKQWARLRDTDWLLDVLGDHRAANYWQRIFDRTYDTQVDYWAYQWSFACWVNEGLAITPKYNLVDNIGFGEGATRTRSLYDKRMGVPVRGIEFPLSHPSTVERNVEADLLAFNQVIAPKPRFQIRLRKKIRRVFTYVNGLAGNSASSN